MQGLELMVSGFVLRVQGSGLRVQDRGLRAEDYRLWFYRRTFRVKDVRCRVQSLEFGPSP